MHNLTLVVGATVTILCGWGSALAQPSTVLVSTKQDRLEHGGFVAEKVYDDVLQSWTVRLTASGHLVGVFSSKQSVFEPRHISLGLHSFLGGSDKQLIVGMWTGGTKCCNVYWIAELEPRFRLIYNGRDYDYLRDSGDGGLQAADIDGDGQIEFWEDTTTFDYFRGAFADSPSVTIYFKYDEKNKAYRPANPTLWPVIMQQIAPLEKAIQQTKTRDDPSKYETEDESEFLHRVHYRRSILTVTLAQIYAGRAKDGWTFFEDQYKFRDKAEWRSAIEQRLKEDYQFFRRFNP